VEAELLVKEIVVQLLVLQVEFMVLVVAVVLELLV
jgi:hypothetical protein